MNEPKFTKGPWGVFNGVQIRSLKDNICKVWMMRNGEGKANANLIAAAPDMYAEIQDDIYYLKRELEVIQQYKNNTPVDDDLVIIGRIVDHEQVIIDRIAEKEDLLARARGEK